MDRINSHIDQFLIIVSLMIVTGFYNHLQASQKVLIKKDPIVILCELGCKEIEEAE